MAFCFDFSSSVLYYYCILLLIARSVVILFSIVLGDTLKKDCAKTVRIGESGYPGVSTIRTWNWRPVHLAQRSWTNLAKLVRKEQKVSGRIILGTSAVGGGLLILLEG